MKLTQTKEAATLLDALPEIDKEMAECVALEEAKVALDQIFLPPMIWAEILGAARVIVLKRLAALGVEVEP